MSSSMGRRTQVLKDHEEGPLDQHHTHMADPVDLRNESIRDDVRITHFTNYPWRFRSSHMDDPGMRSPRASSLF